MRIATVTQKRPKCKCGCWVKKNGHARKDGSWGFSKVCATCYRKRNKIFPFDE